MFCVSRRKKENSRVREGECVEPKSTRRKSSYLFFNIVEFDRTIDMCQDR